MDTHTLIIAAYEVGISLTFGLLTIYISLRLLDRTLLNGPEGSLLLTSNVAVALFAASMILAELILVRQSILPAVEALRAMVIAKHTITAAMVGVSFGYFAAFYAITLVLSLACLYLSVLIYVKATVRMDEMEEIRKDNISVAVLMSAVVMGMALFVEAPVERFLASLVDYESLGRIENVSSSNSKDKLYLVPRE